MIETLLQVYVVLFCFTFIVVGFFAFTESLRPPGLRDMLDMAIVSLVQPLAALALLVGFVSSLVERVSERAGEWCFARAFDPLSAALSWILERIDGALDWAARLSSRRR